MSGQSPDGFPLNVSPAYLTALYKQYLEDPENVDPSLASLFQQVQLETEGENPPWSQENQIQYGQDPDLMEAFGILPDGSQVAPAKPNGSAKQEKPQPQASPVASGEAITEQDVQNSLQALMMIRCYRVRGHLKAKLDPLGLTPPGDHPELDPKAYGLDLNDPRPVRVGGELGFEKATVREIYDRLNQVYSGHLGIEYMHIQEDAEREWFQKKLEGIRVEKAFSVDEKKEIYRNVAKAENFEQFLKKKYPGAKRFGLEGAESTMVALETLVERAALKYKTKEVVLGMAHRGRLNVLCNLLDKPPRMLFKEFKGESMLPKEGHASGDVKYHLGASSDREIGGQKLHLSLSPNPSHLEAVNTVVVGKVRAKQTRFAEHPHANVMGILLHGDAAFAGQGVVSETLDLAKLRGYRVGGTIHIIINNQIGFTTMPAEGRSSPYCSDVAKGVQAPILHVNGDDPVAVAFAAKLAIDYRNTFSHDVILDIFCYRRHGHNEMDEPSFTQPEMYSLIGERAPVKEQFAEALLQEGVYTEEEIEALDQEMDQFLQKEFEESDTFNPEKADWLEGSWSGYSAHGDDELGNTAVDLKVLKEVGERLTDIPEDFNIHPKLQRLMDEKKKMFEAGEGFDWGTAEALAFGTLLREGHPVRLSGQDSSRGTFSHRHARLRDQKIGKGHYPLNYISKDQAIFHVVDSPLSEMGVLGFEYGYSVTLPEALVIWEAQFGDFANGAQVIVDQFIASAEVKWLRLSGLVMLLPHGYEGQGPEHSSARLERYLQLCANNNMIVANCTTPANYFHLLRRQIHRSTRKPLIVMSPKSLLRHKCAVSTLEEMGPGSTFRPVYAEVDRNLVDNTMIRRVILCSGKIYYDLIQAREANEIENIAILRLEQYHPFPEQELSRELSKYRNAQVVWCQEEPMNMGAWTFVDRYLEKLLTKMDHRYQRPAFVGRAAAASTATGYPVQHKLEQESVVNKALMLS